ALFALGKGAAQDQILDPVRVDLDALEEVADHLCCQLVRTHAGELALACEMEGRPGVAGNDDWFHDEGCSSEGFLCLIVSMMSRSSALSSASVSSSAWRCSSSSAMRARPLPKVWRSCVRWLRSA